jgi:hypothetical protein
MKAIQPKVHKIPTNVVIHYADNGIIPNSQ